MRNLMISILVLVLSGCLSAGNMEKPEAQKLDEAKQLVRFSLTDRLLANVQQRARDRYSGYLLSKNIEVSQAENLLDETLAQVMAEEELRLLDALVPIYRRYYTAGEIHQLLSFYRTEVARKSQRVSSKIAAESQQYVRLWNEHFENELLKQVEKALAPEGTVAEP